MLYFSRWKATATILTALIICFFAVPNFFPEATVKSWPKWAQRHIVLGLDLQGGADRNVIGLAELESGGHWRSPDSIGRLDWNAVPYRRTAGVIIDHAH